MKAIHLSRKVHKWIALIVGLQLFIWALSGFYMVSVHIDIIHGDMLVKQSSYDDQSYPQQDLLSFSDVISEHPASMEITLTKLLDQPVYKISSVSNTSLIGAIHGNLISPISKETAKKVAIDRYAGSGNITSVNYLQTALPQEIGFMSPPIWRVDFDDIWGTTFYVSPDTGEFRTRRHTLWRIFNFLWMLHIMDYQERENINNYLLRIATTVAVLLVLSGFWFLYFRLGLHRKRDKQR